MSMARAGVSYSVTRAGATYSATCAGAACTAGTGARYSTTCASAKQSMTGAVPVKVAAAGGATSGSTWTAMSTVRRPRWAE